MLSISKRDLYTQKIQGSSTIDNSKESITSGEIQPKLQHPQLKEHPTCYKIEQSTTTDNEEEDEAVADATTEKDIAEEIKKTPPEIEILKMAREFKDKKDFDKTQ